MPVCSCPCLTKGSIITISSLLASPTDDTLLCPQDLLNSLAVGSLLCLDDGKALLKIKQKTWQQGAANQGSTESLDPVYRLVAKAEALSSLNFGGASSASDKVPGSASGQSQRSALALKLENPGYSLAWVTLSDKGSRGEREDKSGPLIEEMARQCLQLRHVQGYIIPDEEPLLRALLTDLALVQGYDIILTTGGTGVSPRDITPEAMQKILERELPGFSAAMLMASLSKTPHAAISRAKAGILGTSLIINLPGSPKAVAENLVAVLPAIGHTLEKIKGDPSDCGR